MPEVRIIVREEHQGPHAMREAAEDQEKLENKTQSAPERRGNLRQQNEEYRKSIEALEAEQRRKNAKTADPNGANRMRKQATRAEDEGILARGEGDLAAAAKWERKAEILRRTIGLQKQLNVSEAEARSMASGQVAAEEKIAAAKLAAVAAERAKKQAAADTRAAQANAASDEKTGMRRLVFNEGLAGAKARAGGDPAAAAALEKNAEILRRSLVLQTALKVSQGEALGLAAAQVAAEEEIAAAKLAEVAAAKLAKKEEEESAAATRIRLAEEKAITREKEKQLAESTANKKMALGRAAGGFDGAAGTGGVASGLLNPAMLIAALSAAVIGKTIKDEMAAADNKAKEQGNLNATFNRSRRNRNRENTVEAEEKSASEYQRNKQEIEDTKDQEGSFADEGFLDRVFNTSNNLLGTSFETSSQAAERKRKDKLARLEKEQPRIEKDAAEAFTKGTGGAELRILEERAKGHHKVAREIGYQVEWSKEYDRVLQRVGNSEKGQSIAREAASLKVYETQRQTQQAIAGMINARSGRADVARAASLAGDVGKGGSGSRVERAIEGLTNVVDRNHQESIGLHLRPGGRR
jgi:hypothetical protein